LLIGIHTAELFVELLLDRWSRTGWGGDEPGPPKGILALPVSRR